MDFQPNALEIFWDNLLSRDPVKILAVLKPLNSHDRNAAIQHLQRMVNEEGWHDEQRQSALSALKVIETISGDDT
jgi:hypothetical protein